MSEVKRKYARKEEVIEESSMVCRSDISSIINEAIEKLAKVPLMALTNKEVTHWRNLYKMMVDFNKLLMSK